MKRQWSEIRADLRKQAVTRSAPAANEFWTDFRARARLRAQDRPATMPPALPLFRRWAIASAGALTVALLLLTGILVSSRGTTGGFSQMDSLQVDAPYSGVLMMNDEDTQSTTVWILDMDTGDAKGDGA